MTVKDFHESVAFRLTLNKWASSQPGYGSPVAQEDVENVMVKIRPQLRKSKRNTRLTSADLAKLKYSILVQIKETRTPKQEPFVMPENQSKQIWEKLMKELQKEKLIVPAKTTKGTETQKFRVTNLGRRYVADFIRSPKAEK